MHPSAPAVQLIVGAPMSGKRVTVQCGFVQVQGGYDFPGSNSARDVYSLTGGRPAPTHTLSLPKATASRSFLVPRHSPPPPPSMFKHPRLVAGGDSDTWRRRNTPRFRCQRSVEEVSETFAPSDPASAPPPPTAPSTICGLAWVVCHCVFPRPLCRAVYPLRLLAGISRGDCVATVGTGDEDEDTLDSVGLAPRHAYAVRAPAQADYGQSMGRLLPILAWALVV
jgi:hypothetical protein